MFSTAFPFTLKRIFGLLFSAIFAVASILGTIGTGYTKEMPVADPSFTPAVRFVVCTDSHDENDTIKDMVETVYDIYGDDGIDVIVHTGDFTGIGLDSQMIAFRDALYEAVDGRSETLVVLGNHDLKQGYDADVRFEKIFGVPAQRHIVVNGFHFIGVPSCTQSAIQLYPPSKVAWARDQLKQAEKESDNLPVFTFQHPHNRGTVYGSTIWGTDDLARVWNGHNRVVNFSGHSHFPIEDPRSIWQGSYTALGVGGMARFELEQDLIWGRHPEGYDTAKQFYVVEADRDGSVKIDSYDMNTNTIFCTYYIENVNDPSTYAYTYKNRLAYDDAPVFGENATAEYEINDSGEVILTFDKATDKFAVHDYKVIVKNRFGLPLPEKTFLSDYYLQKQSDRMTVNLGKLPLINTEKGFSVEITASNCYYELSQPLCVSFK